MLKKVKTLKSPKFLADCTNGRVFTRSVRLLSVVQPGGVDKKSQKPRPPPL